MALGHNLRTIREGKGLSQDDLSRLTGYDEETGHGVSQGAISAIEKRDSQSSKHAPALAKALGVDLHVLISGVYQSTDAASKSIASEPSKPYNLKSAVVEYLSMMERDEMNDWLDEIKVEANKARRNKERSVEKEHGNNAHAPPSERRHIA